MTAPPASTVEGRAREAAVKLWPGDVEIDLWMQQAIADAYLAAAEAERPHIEIDALERAAKLVCDYCASDEEPFRRRVIDEKKKLYMHGRNYCLANGIVKELHRLRATLEQNGGGKK